MDSECIRVRLLGSLEVRRRDQVGSWSLVGREAFGKPKHARSVLKRLLTAPGRRLSRGQIQDDLWPEIDMGLADSYLYNAITKVRSAIGRELVVLTDSIYEIAEQRIVWVDIDHVTGLMNEIENQDRFSVSAIALLEEALGYLTRGAALEGEDGTWCYSVRRRAEDMLRQARLWLADAYEVQGKIWQACEQYRALCRALPPDEDALRIWMEMLRRQGKTQEALKVYQDAQTCAEQQGYALSPAVTAFAQQVREQADLALVSPAQPLRAIIRSEETIIGEHDYMDRTRREISLQGAKIALGLAALPLDALGKRLLVALRHHSPDGETVLYLHQRIEHYWEQRQTAKLGPVLIPYVSDDLQHVLALLEGPLLPDARTELTVITGNLAMLLGELFYELNRYPEARDYYKIAAMAAHEAGNPVLEAVIYGRRSLTWTYQNHLDVALSGVQKGRALAEHDTHVTVWLAAMEAEIHAKQGNQDGCLASLKDAAHLRDLPDQQPFYWMHFDLSLLAGYEGACFLRLKKPYEAHQALTQALELLDATTARRKPRLLIDLAQAYVQQGNIEAACVTSRQAADLLHSIKSPVTHKRLLALRKELAPWQQTAAVQQLDEAMYHLTETRE